MQFCFCFYYAVITRQTAVFWARMIEFLHSSHLHDFNAFLLTLKREKNVSTHFLQVVVKAKLMKY